MVYKALTPLKYLVSLVKIFLYKERFVCFWREKMKIISSKRYRAGRDHLVQTVENVKAILLNSHILSETSS